MGGFANTDQYADAGVFILTGFSKADMVVPPYGQYGTLSGSTFDMGIVADSSTTGYLHCTSGSCSAAGFTLSIQKPLTPTGSGPFPLTLLPWNFGASAAGAPGAPWTSPVLSTTIPANPPATPYTNIIQTQYVGAEISRTFVPEPSMLTMLLPGIGLLGALGLSRRR